MLARPAWFLGKHVKAAFFSAVDRTEWMWVLVDGEEEGNLLGVLCNDPLLPFDPPLACDDRVVVARTSIAEVLAPD